MPQNFNRKWNPYYDFENRENLDLIAAVDLYSLERDGAFYNTGDVIQSPWGTNQVIDVAKEQGGEICVKVITVNPGAMLSLQRHRGREETWMVKEGVLTAILDGELIEVAAGHAVLIKRGAVHCMINSSDAPVVIIETQKGICREKDNIRLIDMNGRATYPLTTEIEFRSACLYAQIQNKHAKRFAFVSPRNKLLLAGGEKGE